MKPTITRGILIAIAIILWLVLVVYHLVQGVTDTHPVMILPIAMGDLGYRLVFVGFLAATGFFFERLFLNIEKLNVTTLLWRQFITGMGGIAVVMMVTFANRASSTLLAPGIHRYLQAIYFSLVLLALSVFFLSALFIYRRFILYPRTKRKILLWRVFMGFLALGFVFQVYPMGIVVPISYIPFLILSLILAANVRWIPYLNFNQKLRALGLLALIALVITTFLIAGIRLPVQLGFIIDNFIRLDFLLYTILFTIIYTLVAILVLFFNLPTSSLFEKESVEIVSFTKINQAVQSNLDFTDLTNTLLDASLMASNARAGWVEMIPEGGSEPEITLTKRIPQSEVSRISEGQDFTHKLLKDQKPLLVRNLKKLKNFQGGQLRYRSLLGIPIISSSKSYGAVFVVSELSNAFEDEAIKSIRSFAEQTGIALENAKLINDSIEVERYQEQLKIARRVQKELLPQSLPKSDQVHFAARSENAQEVGGDYFDVVTYSPGKYRVAIGDVSGKGTTAAFYMAETKGIFHALARLDLHPCEFMAIANQALSECMQPGFFMTLTYLHIDESLQQVELLRAGHCPAFFYQSETGQIQELRNGSLGLGIVRSSKFADFLKSPDVIQYKAGDILLLYTDGINEARDQAGEEFGYERIKQILANNQSGSPENLAETLVQSAQNFAQHELSDDYTVLAIKFS